MAQSSRRSPGMPEVVSSSPGGGRKRFISPFFFLRTDTKKNFFLLFFLMNGYKEKVHRNTAFAFPTLKKSLPKDRVCFPMKYDIRHIDRSRNQSMLASLIRALSYHMCQIGLRRKN